MSNIQAGDLVILIRTHGCMGNMNPYLGHIFIVTGLLNTLTYCPSCLALSRTSNICALGLENYSTPIVWLKKIPPLDELETTEQEEKLTA